MLKYEIEDLSELSESTELLKTKPKGLSKFCTFIILILVFLVLIWSLLFKKSIYITCTGSIESSDNNFSIYATEASTISKINVKDGDYVSIGDTLFTLNCDEYITQKKSLSETINYNKKKLNSIEKLKNIINDSNFNFDITTDTDIIYYKKYEIYLSEYNSLICTDEALNYKINSINNKINNLKLLNKSIIDNCNLFDNSSSYYYRYIEFKMKIENYDKLIKQYENVSKQTSNHINSQDNEYNDLASIKNEKEFFINSTLQSIASEIEECNESLISLSPTNSANKFKEEYILSLDTEMDSLRTLILTNTTDLDLIDIKINKCNITSPSNGIVNIKSDFKEGDYINTGTLISNIITNENKNFKVKLFIDSNKFADIKEDQEVLIELVSLPSTSYGNIKSKLKNISIDADMTDNFGNKFYTAEAFFTETFLTDHKNNKVEIKNGMNATVKILNRKISYLRYFLEKINFIN